MLGLSCPPQYPRETAYIFNSWTGAPQALPARADSRPWRYISVSTNLGAPHNFAAGVGTTGDAAPDAENNPWFSLTRADGPFIVNVSGCTHVSGFGSGGGTFRISAIDNISTGGGGMLRSPPQVGSGTGLAIDTSSAGHTALPNNSAGKSPKYVMLSFSSATSLSVGLTDGTTSTSHFYIQRDMSPFVINVAGFTHIYNAAVAGELIVAPLEF